MANHYEVHGIFGAALPPSEGGGTTLNDAEKEIAFAYQRAAKEGGRVIASHNMLVQRQSPGEQPTELVSMLYLVLELPPNAEPLFPDEPWND